jgi:hypothetical protein
MEVLKTATDPTMEAITAARLASERADQTKNLHEVEDSISKWEIVVQSMADSSTVEDQVDILTSYAEAFFLRWSLNHRLDDMRSILSILENALNKIPHSSTKLRYAQLIRLAKAHESWHQNSKDNLESLHHAIKYWEDAYGLSVTLHWMKEAVHYSTFAYSLD